MVRKLERRRVRGALDRFGPPLESGSIKILDDADDEAPVSYTHLTLPTNREV